MKKRRANFRDYNIDNSWTLFLDRDGVINKKIENDYVLRWEDFKFLPGVTDALKIFNNIFGKIIIITNQQCIGKGFMTEADLKAIHDNMLKEIKKSGGRVDAVYFAPNVKEHFHIDRKPNVGMALKARKAFPSIDFKRSVMAGDSLSDMEFGHRLGMLNVLISEEPSVAKDHAGLISFWARDLNELAQQLNG